MPLATAPLSQHLDDLTKRLRDVLWRHCDRTATALVEEQEEPVFGLSDETANLLLDLAENRRQTGRTEQGFAQSVATWGSVEYQEFGGFGKDQRVQVVCRTLNGRTEVGAEQLRYGSSQRCAERSDWNGIAKLASPAERPVALLGQEGNRIARTGSSSVPCHNL